MNHAPLALCPLTALSPLDGRYADKTAPLRRFFSEYGLIHARMRVEIGWLVHLSEQPGIREVTGFSAADKQFLAELVDNFSLQSAADVKQIEAKTRHDVKAVEYFIKRQLAPRKALAAVSEFVHFACTSEDINNLSYGLMLMQAREQVLLPSMQALIRQVESLAARYADCPMLARTHGQPATPTTLGKELANLADRLRRAGDAVAKQPICGKINGAVGNFNAHLCAYPELDWPQIARAFVTGLGLEYLPLTTQIEPHDYIAELCHGLMRFNSIVLDLDRDIWGYIALHYFNQQEAPGEVGSSTMPHKINPIDFENSEGNLGMANALLGHLAEKLPVSRWQRDLSDSTVLRNLGVGCGYALLAMQSSGRGLARLALNPAQMQRDLDDNWAVLTEPIQTVMRRYGIEQPYEKLKALTRTAGGIDQATLAAFIQSLDLPTAVKARLLALTPARYIGNAAAAARSLLPPTAG